jgi:uncharacterized membrane protein YfcA
MAPADLTMPRASQRTLRLAVIGTAAGLFSGVFGVGGGAVIVPLLLLWMGYENREATGTSLGAIVIIAAAAMLAEGAYGNVHVDDGLLVGIPAVGGVLAGTALQQRVPRRTVTQLFAVLLVATAVSLLVEPHDSGGSSNHAVAVAIPVGALAGVVAGMLGVGGGILFVPVLTLGLGLSPVEANATSLLAIIPVAFVGAANQARYGNFRLRDAVVIGTLAVPGAIAGVALVNVVPERAVQIGFSVLMLFVAWQLVQRERRPIDAPGA